MTPTASRRYATDMDAAYREAVAPQLVAGCKEMVVRLRELAAQLEELAPPDAYEVMTWLQPHVDQSLAETNRILEAIDAKT